MKITMHSTKLEKNPNTKTTYLKGETIKKEITKEQYHNITNDSTLKAFRRFGGFEYAVRSYTCNGYNVTRLTSTSPDKQTKHIREFSFEC